MDFVANNWVFILILVLFVGMHMIRFGEGREDGDSARPASGRAPKIPSPEYSRHEPEARTLEAGASQNIRHAIILKGDRK